MCIVRFIFDGTAAISNCCVLETLPGARVSHHCQSLRMIRTCIVICGGMINHRKSTFPAFPHRFPLALYGRAVRELTTWLSFDKIVGTMLCCTCWLLTQLVVHARGHRFPLVLYGRAVELTTWLSFDQIVDTTLYLLLLTTDPACSPHQGIHY